MSVRDVLAPSGTSEQYAQITAANALIAARLEYVKQHGAGFLFRNQPPPVPGYPRLRGRKVEL